MKFYCCYNVHVLVQAVINSNGTYEKTCKKMECHQKTNKQISFKYTLIIILVWNHKFDVNRAQI